MKYFSIPLVLALFWALTSGSAVAEPAAMVLERGIFLEQTLGDVEAATLLYEELLTRENLGKRHAAETSFRLANCLAKQERYAQATRHLLRVVKNYGEFKELAEKAGVQVIDISQELAREGIALDGNDANYMGDLLYALSASLSFENSELTREISSEANRMLTILSKNAAGSEDESIFTDCARLLEKAATFIAANKRMNAADLFDESDATDFFMYRDMSAEALMNVFESPLHWKDRLAESIAQEDRSAVKRLAAKIESYLEPLESLPDSSEEKVFAQALRKDIRELAALAQDDLAAATALLFKQDKQRHAADGALMVIVDDLDLLPETEGSRFFLAFNFIHSGIKAFEANDGESATEYLRKSAETLDKISSVKKISRKGKQMLKVISETLNEAREMADSGNHQAALKLLQNEFESTE